MAGCFVTKDAKSIIDCGIATQRFNVYLEENRPDTSRWWWASLVVNRKVKASESEPRIHRHFESGSESAEQENTWPKSNQKCEMNNNDPGGSEVTYGCGKMMYDTHNEWNGGW